MPIIHNVQNVIKLKKPIKKILKSKKRNPRKFKLFSNLKLQNIKTAFKLESLKPLKYINQIDSLI